MSNSDEKNYPTPNLDLINMVQRARMAHDADVAPSQAASMYWIEAKRSPDIAAPPITARAAQWVITTTAQRVDKLWEQIKAATEAGKLGYKSKVCTSSRTPQNPDQRIILVCTYDKNDTDDVERVRVALLDMILDDDQMYYGQL